MATSSGLKATTSPASNQSATQSPQTATASDFGPSQASGSVQPGTAASLLKSSNGIKLSPTALPGVSLPAASDADTATSSAKATSAPVAKHHVNVPLLCFAGLLILVALVLFWTATKSVKKTT